MRRLTVWWTTSGLGGPSDRVMERLPRITLSLLGYCFAVAVPAVIMSAAYFGNPVSWMISWLVREDFLCDAPTQGIGSHCFGDFYAVRAVLLEPSAWDNRIGGIPYLPVAMWPNVLARKLEMLGLGTRGSLVFFLVLVVTAVLVPAIWAAWKLRHRFPPGVVFALAGGMTLPVFSIFDRANVTGFVVPLILAFIVTLRRGPAWVAPVALIGIVMIRPQFLALGALLLVVGRWRHLLYAIEGAVVVLPLSFILWDSSKWVSNLQAWLTASSGFQNYQSLQSYLPTNLSASRTLYRGSELFNSLHDGLGDSLARTVLDNSRAIGILVLLVTLGLLVLGRSVVPLAPGLVLALSGAILVTSPTYVYYLVIGLLVVAVLLVPDSLHLGEGDGFAFFPRRMRTLWIVVTLFAVVLSLVPIPFAFEPGRQSLGLESAGPAWLLAWAVSVIVIAADILRDRAWTTRPAPAPAPPTAEPRPQPAEQGQLPA